MSAMNGADPFDLPPAGKPGAGADHWVQVTMVVPPNVAAAVIEFLGGRFGYRHVPDDIDWCVWERRDDFSQVQVAPCEPATRSAYVVDWRQGEGRGDVPVVLPAKEKPC